MKTLIHTLLLGLAVLPCASLHAGVLTWNGSSNNTFGNPSNWQTNVDAAIATALLIVPMGRDPQALS